jgi:hypothetical protein
MDAENISVSISLEKRWAMQNLIPITLGIIIVRLAWMASFFAEIVANTGRHEAVFHSRTISAKNAKRKGKNKNPPSPPFNKGGLGGD